MRGLESGRFLSKIPTSPNGTACGVLTLKIYILPRPEKALPEYTLPRRKAVDWTREALERLFQDLDDLDKGKYS